MKKLFYIIIMLLLCIPLVSFTDAEFYEVYDQLQVMTDIAEQQQNDIKLLNEQVDKLIAENTRLTDLLEKTKTDLEDTDDLLKRTIKSLEDSNKVINNLNKKFYLGAGVITTSLNDINGLKFGLVAGYRVLDRFLFNLDIMSSVKFDSLALGMSLQFSI